MDLETIKRIPILEIARRLGIETRGNKAMCFGQHDKQTPSLSFHVGRNYWHCFGSCGKGGDGVALVQAVLDLDFKQTLDWFQREFRGPDSAVALSVRSLKP